MTQWHDGASYAIMEITSTAQYPGSMLSNFAPHSFVFDGVECASMEGFLQSLKFESEEVQVAVCQLAGVAAKRRGMPRDWKSTQTLFWKGQAIDRHSEEYQDLLDGAYDMLSQNDGFIEALLATGDERLTHSIGRQDPQETILTRAELCDRLMKIREELQDAAGPH